MKAVVYHGKHDVRVDEVPRPQLESSTDAIIRVTAAAICGSDLHLYDRAIPGMLEGDILGHEFMGVIEELGDDVGHVAVGQRVVVPFVIACGQCQYCQRDQYSLCDRTNPAAKMLEPIYGHSPAGLFGYTQLFGGYPGGQAEYVRVPHADVGLFAVPDTMSDDDALMLTDVLPTGWMAAKNCDIHDGDIIAIAGAGPVGQLAAQSAMVMGAAQVIVIDSEQDRLDEAAQLDGVVTLNPRHQNVQRELRTLTSGRGPDAVIDAVGMEASGGGALGLLDRLKQRARIQTGRPTALRHLIKAVRKGGRVSIPGVYAGFVDTFPLGVVFGKGLILTGGQTHVHAYIPELIEHIQAGRLHPGRIVSTHLSLDEAPEGYRGFKDKEFLKVVLRPSPEGTATEVLPVG